MYDRFDEFVSSPFDMDATDELDLADLDDLPTAESDRPDLAGPSASGSGELVCSTLPISADEAFDIFCDIDNSPEWISVLKSARVLGRTDSGRPLRAAFLARLQNASIGYTLYYRYEEKDRTVSWGTAPGSMTLVAGTAQFAPLGDKACLMNYRLTLELPGEALPPWEDPFFSGHASSVVMNDFRDYLSRIRHR